MCWDNTRYNGLCLLVCPTSDEETEAMFLVDFTQKIIDRKKETRDQIEREEEERTMAAPVPEPQNPGEEW